MYTKLEHKNKGDNIAGNKYQQNIYSIKTDLGVRINSKISELDNKEKLNLADDKILTALKEIVLELIEEEQKKAHQIVPIGKIRSKFKSLCDDSTFEKLIKQLLQDKSIEIENTQICFLNNQTEYKINI